MELCCKTLYILIYVDLHSCHVDNTTPACNVDNCMHYPHCPKDLYIIAKKKGIAKILIKMSNKADIPGEATHTATALLETVAAAVQAYRPINKIHHHLCAFHFYSDDMSRQVEAHHYCAHLNQEVRQCLIFDTPEKDARLIGIEYMITENLFLTLPDDEKPLWHSHEYEVKSGVLFLPGIPGPIERLEMEKVCKTYGKVFHFWQVDRGDILPVGIPQLMMALTRDGQLDESLAEDVEKRHGVSFGEQRKKREYMLGPDDGIHPMANGGGGGLKTELRETLQ